MWGLNTQGESERAIKPVCGNLDILQVVISEKQNVIADAIFIEDPSHEPVYMRA